MMRYAGRRVNPKSARVTQPSRQLKCEVVNLLDVQYGVVRLEEAVDRGLVDLHLRAADAERAVADDAVAVGTLVVQIDALDAGRRDAVEVDRHLQRLQPDAELARQQYGARGT